LRSLSGVLYSRAMIGDPAGSKQYNVNTLSRDLKKHAKKWQYVNIGNMY